VKGYHLFVDSLLRVDNLDQSSIERICKGLNTEGDTQSLMKKTSAMLSEITKLASITVLLRAEQQELHQVKFALLSDNRVPIILVFGDFSGTREFKIE